MKEVTLKLVLQKYKGAWELSINNCTPTSLIAWKKWNNSWKNKNTLKIKSRRNKKSEKTNISKKNQSSKTSQESKVKG
jgi:hypothetical protein